MKKHQHTNHLSYVRNKASNAGRSMVEMLGTLAIIGVLSIGGLAGYKMAITRYKANAILNAFSLAWVSAYEYYYNGNVTGDPEADRDEHAEALLATCAYFLGEDIPYLPDQDNCLIDISPNEISAEKDALGNIIADANYQGMVGEFAITDDPSLAQAVANILGFSYHDEKDTHFARTDMINIFDSKDWVSCNDGKNRIESNGSYWCNHHWGE